MLRTIIMILGLCIALASHAQIKSLDTSLLEEKEREKDSLMINKNRNRYQPDSDHNPGLAIRRSLIIPGWGQYYNRRWWKIPIIYTGIGLLSSAVVFNQKNYRQFLRVYNLVRSGQRPTSEDSPGVQTLYTNISKQSLTAIENAVNGYQRNMQLSILGFAGAWGIQVIDAYIDAKFIHSYTMDRNLSYKVKPAVLFGPGNGMLGFSAIPMLTLVVSKI